MTRRESDEDRELEDAVEAEFQAANQRALDMRAMGITAFVPSPESIRRRLIAERKEAQEAELRDLQKRKLRRDLGEDASAKGEPRARGSASYPRGAFNTAVKPLRAGEDIRKIARETGISRNRVARIRDCYVSPGPDGPDYEAIAGPIANTVILRRRF